MKVRALISSPLATLLAQTQTLAMSEERQNMGAYSRLTKFAVCRYSGPTVRYVSDVMMPNGLYGPVFGFLLRLALPF